MAGVGTVLRRTARLWIDARLSILPPWLEELVWIALVAAAVVAGVLLCFRFPLLNLVVVAAAAASIVAMIRD